MNFWARVKTEIKKQNTTQAWIASLIPVRHDLFRSWTSKGIMPNADQAVVIAKALGVTVEYLVTGEDQTLPSEHIRRLLTIAEKLSLEDVEELISFASFKLNRKSP